MKESLQFGDKAGPGAFAGSILGRLVAAIVGLGVLGVSVFLGAIFLAVVVGLVLIAAIVISIRIWWLKRKLRQHAREYGDIEAEYVEIHETQDGNVKTIEVSSVKRHE